MKGRSTATPAMPVPDLNAAFAFIVHLRLDANPRKHGTCSHYITALAESCYRRWVPGHTAQSSITGPCQVWSPTASFFHNNLFFQGQLHHERKLKKELTSLGLKQNKRNNKKVKSCNSLSRGLKVRFVNKDLACDPSNPLLFISEKSILTSKRAWKCKFC